MLEVAISAAARLGYSFMMAWVLIRVGHMLCRSERAGIGLMGGAGLMTVAVILDKDSHGTPFDVWAGALFTLGGILFFTGFVRRKVVHDRRNEVQKDYARAHLAGRGKL